MKYPKINKKELNKENKLKFNQLKSVIKESIEFDVQENDLKLTKKDVDLLVWNSATCCIAMISTSPSPNICADEALSPTSNY